MNSKLLYVLVSKGIVKAGTELYANYRGRNLDGHENLSISDYVRVVQAFAKDETIVKIKAVKVYNNEEVIIKPDNILTIEGMEPVMFAKAYDLKEDGTKMEVKLDEFGMPVRRGRKTNATKEKIRQMQENT